MSITSAMFTGVSGLLANAEGINVIGNNLSNVNTVGFKSSRMLFSDMLSANIGNGSQIGRGTQIQKVDDVFSQSTFETTELVTDLAIQGDGFFALQDASGNALYSRAGAFRMDSQNKYLVNPDGLKVLDSAGAPIDLSTLNVAGPPAVNFTKVSSVDADGTITALMSDGTTKQYATKLGIATVPNPGGLEKRGGTLYAATAQSGTVTTAAPTTNDKIFSNSLEISNVDMAGQFVKMILTQRAYSANSKTITTADEMTQEVLNLKR
ncbi:flagellar hook-basal body protein [Geobacter sp. SVR]|uniref:flagellar hook-basal body protein n=1 Tax=Geobacter sp. SVR TaxID=2495594 RepID=UPI00143EFBEC|nr:flagellar hook basal-body protein [Geobacter sp. SVR]BCS55819.1 flagellar basal body protein [Geobacter sp. SVR]GCF83823.1 flagellar basal body protein [Geobacter sp. SVR]